VSFERDHLENALASLNGLAGAEPADQPGPAPRGRDLRCAPPSFKAVHAAIDLDPSFLSVPEARRGMEESVLSALALSLAPLPG